MRRLRRARCLASSMSASTKASSSSRSTGPLGRGGRGGAVTVIISPLILLPGRPGEVVLDPRAVLRGVRQPLLPAAVGVHDVELGGAVARAAESDLPTVWRPER